MQIISNTDLEWQYHWSSSRCHTQFCYGGAVRCGGRRMMLHTSDGLGLISLSSALKICIHYMNAWLLTPPAAVLCRSHAYLLAILIFKTYWSGLFECAGCACACARSSLPTNSYAQMPRWRQRRLAGPALHARGARHQQHALGGGKLHALLGLQPVAAQHVPVPDGQADHGHARHGATSSTLFATCRSTVCVHFIVYCIDEQSRAGQLIWHATRTLRRFELTAVMAHWSS